MPTEKTYTVHFNTMDNFTRKYEAIKKKLDDFKEKTFLINFDIDSAIGGKVAALSDKLESSYGDVSKAAGGAEKATDRVAKAEKGGADAANQHAEANKKHASLIETIQKKYEGLTGSLGDYKDKLAGLSAAIVGGSIAGISWQASEKSSLYKSQMFTQIEALRGSKRQDMEAVRAFAEAAGSTGYTSSTERLSMFNMLAGRGGKQRSIRATENIEKIYYANQEFLQQEGIAGSAGDLANFASMPVIRGKMQKDMLNRFFAQYGIKNFASKSQAQRIKILGSLDLEGKIDMDAEKAKRPLTVIKDALGGIRKAVGDELKGPMNSIANVFAKILGAVASSPMLSKIAAWGVALGAVAGVLVTIIGLLPSLKSGLMAVNAGMKLLGASSLLNPYTALIALAGIILLVLYKTGYLSKAWKEFTKSAIGQDFLAGIRSLAAWVATLIDKFNEWYEASGKSQLLSAFESIADVLGTAWDYINSIYTKTKELTGSSLLGFLYAIATAPLAITAAAVGGLTGKSSEDILKGVQSILKKIYGIFEWIYSLWQSFWSWIKSAIPGAAKESKREQIVKRAGTLGLNFDSATGTLSYASGYQKGTTTTTSDSKLNKLIEEWEDLPGFAEGIADAVKKGLGNIGDTIASKIKGAFPDFDFSPLTDAFTGLKTKLEEWITKLQEWIDKIKWPWSGSGESGETSTTTLPGAAAALTLADIQDSAQYRNKNTGLTESGLSLKARITDSGANPADWELAGHAAGVTFTKTGYYSGKFHGPEETLPQATTIRGPGTIARALAALDARTASGSGSSGVTEIHHHNNFDFTNLKVSNDYDLEDLFKKIERKVESTSVEAVKKQLAQRRN